MAPSGARLPTARAATTGPGRFGDVAEAGAPADPVGLPRVRGDAGRSRPAGRAPYSTR